MKLNLKNNFKMTLKQPKKEKNLIKKLEEYQFQLKKALKITRKSI